MVESGSLENCCTFTGTVGSNPTLSAITSQGSWQLQLGSKMCLVATGSLPWLFDMKKEAGRLFDSCYQQEVSGYAFD